jgi:aminoglycoside phosphotransferase family enzyme
MNRLRKSAPASTPPPPAATTLAETVAALSAPQAYPTEPEAAIEVIETHMSFVFLTERHAYKLKKPVRYEFLDFSSLASRRRYCLEELRINRRLAGEVYLAVVPLVRTPDGRLRLEAEGEVVDWLVKMRRLPAERMLDALIRRRALGREEVRRLAVLLASFYRESRPERLGGSQYLKRLAAAVRANEAALAEPAFGLERRSVQALHAAQRAFLARRGSWLARRAEQGHIVEGHGDLRPEHVCLLEPPIVFDRLEFNRQFRLVDPADELASLDVECERLGEAGVGSTLWRVYQTVTGDRPPLALIAFYKSYRASLRAKLAIWHLRELPRAAWPKWQALAGEYLALAEKYARRSSVERGGLGKE